MPADTSKQTARASCISYAKADQAKAQEIADSLEERGFRCWIAPRDVKPGRAYGDEIIRGIEGARNFILVLSSASNGSGFVSREIERAVSKNKPVFTIRVEDVEPAPALELFISSTQWIDAYKGRLGPQIDRLASLLAEEDGTASAPIPVAEGRKTSRLPRWIIPAGAVSAAFAAGLAGLFIWLGPNRPGPLPLGDPSLISDPASLNHQRNHQVAAASPGEDADTSVGGGQAPAGSAPARGSESQSASLEAGFFGSDTRRAFSDFPDNEREKLLARFGYVGALVGESGPVCNATLVGRDLVLTSNYCFAGHDPAELSFRIIGKDGKVYQSKLLRSVASDPLRGLSAVQRVAMATLADPVGDEIGWVKSIGGDPKPGEKLDIVAVDVTSASSPAKIAGAATNDPNCAVIGAEQGTDIFSHRCASPMGSGGAPLFAADSGALLGIVGETNTKDWIGIAYRANVAPGLTQVACTVTDPTGTPLNVRDGPNGQVVGTVSNGLVVAIVESKIASNGKPWVKIVNTSTQSPVGWVFRDFVSCP